MTQVCSRGCGRTGRRATNHVDVCTHDLTLERLLEIGQVDATRANDCWLWQINFTGYGYGRVTNRWNGEGRAHRLSYLLANGEFDRKLKICHRCDTPACINPAHLFAGTQQDNLADMRAKGRMVNLGAAAMTSEERRVMQRRAEQQSESRPCPHCDRPCSSSRSLSAHVMMAHNRKKVTA